MENPPHIVVVSWHDTGRHFGCYGAKTVHTPNVDRLAAEGLCFTSAYTCAPVCGPSRGAAMTGRYPVSNGLYGQPHEGWRLNPDEKHLARRLKESGYTTALCGFQHETGKNEEAALGFDEVRAVSPEPGRWFPPVPRAERVVKEALTWLDERAAAGDKSPRYLQIGFWETHRPYLEPEIEPDAARGVFVPTYVKDTPTAQRDFAELQGSIRSADAALGQLLGGLEERGMRDNTLVVFWTDHGLPVPRAKLTGYDPGLEIALILRWPGRIAPGTNDRLVSNVDLLPTLAELVGLPADPRWQGTSALSGPERGEIFACCYLGDLRILRTRTHKLIRNLSKLTEYGAPVDLDDAGHYVLQREKGMRAVGPLELYDLAADPMEQNNLAKKPEHAALLRELDGRLTGWMRRCGDPALRGPTLAPRWRQFLNETAE